MKKILTTVFVLLTTVLLVSCIKDNPVIQQQSDQVTTTVFGIVNDEAGNPVSGAKISIGDKKDITITKANGSFIAFDVNVPAKRLVVLCKKAGYFTGARAETPVGGGGTPIHISMMSSTANGTVSGSSGGTVNAGTGASVQLPSNAVSGYTGTINVAARHVDPVSSTFYNFFDGDEEGKRADGSETSLLSYGVLRVQLTNTSGQELQLASGKSATLTYPIPSSMQANAPASMPLWYFDEALGMWKEEGVANRVGSNYVGTVNHFSSWNCDDPSKIAYVKGKVVDGCLENSGVPNIVVTIGQRQVTTAADGSFMRRVPLLTAFDVYVDPALNGGLGSNVVHVLPMTTAGETKDVGNLTLNAATVTGTIVDCNNAPIAGAVMVNWVTGSAMAYTSTGSFKVYAEPNKIATIEATSSRGGYIILPIITPNACQSVNVGQLLACLGEGDVVDFQTVSGAGALSVSADGSVVAAGSWEYQQNGTKGGVYSTSDGLLLATLKESGPAYGVDRIQLTASGAKIVTDLFSYFGNTHDSVMVWDAANGSIIKSFKKTISSPQFTPAADALIAIDQNTTPAVVRLDASSGAELSRYGYAFTTSPKSYKSILGLRSSGSECIISEGQEMPKRDSIGTGLIRGPVKFAFWNMSSNSLVNSFTIGDNSTVGSEFVSNDGTIIGFSNTGYENYDTVKFFNSATGQQIASHVFATRYNNASGHAISSDNTSFVVQDILGTTYLSPAIYNIQTGQKVKDLRSPVEAVGRQFVSFAYSADGTRVVGSYQDKNYKWHVVVWKVK